MRDLIRQIEKDFPIKDIEKISLGLIFYYYLSARQEEFYDKLQGITEPTNEEFEEQTSSKSSKNSAYSQLTDAQAKEFEQQSVAELGYFIPPSLLLNQKSFDNGEFITRDSLEEIFQNFYDSITDENTKRLLDGVFTFVLTTLDQNYEYDSSLKNLIEQLVKQLPNILTQYKKYRYRSFVYDFAKQIVASADYYNRDRHQYRRSQGFNDFLAQLAFANKESVESIYDMTCYSGDLLNETVKQLGVQKIKRICGQEHDATMYDFCRMNLFAQQIPSEKLDIRCGNFVTSPDFGTEGAEKFDVILHNMPYEIPIDKNLNFDGQKTSRNSSQDAQVSKLRELIIPETLTHSKTKLSRFVYIFHALKHLAEHGTAVILCSSNFLRTIKEDKEENPVFRYLLGITEGHNGYIDTIVQFNEENMAILVLKKNRPSSQIFFAADYGNSYPNKFADICLQRQDYADDDYVAKVVDLKTVRSEKSILPYTYLPAPDIREKIDVERIQANIEQERKKQENIRARIDEFLDRDNQA